MKMHQNNKEEIYWISRDEYCLTHDD